MALGAALALTFQACALQETRQGLVITLNGDLGSGKTTLTRGVLRGLGWTGPVKSPTYSLVELYVVSGLTLHHFDFYRLDQPEDFLDAGLDDAFPPHAICLVEWPDKAAPYVPPADVDIALEDVRDAHAGGRRACLRAHSPRGQICLNALEKQLSLINPSSL